MSEKIKTKYGIIDIIEDDNGVVEVRYDTQSNILIETIRTNRIETIKDISDLEC